MVLSPAALSAKDSVIDGFANPQRRDKREEQEEKHSFFRKPFFIGQLSAANQQGDGQKEDNTGDEKAGFRVDINVTQIKMKIRVKTDRGYSNDKIINGHSDIPEN